MDRFRNVPWHINTLEKTISLQWNTLSNGTTSSSAPSQSLICPFDATTEKWFESPPRPGSYTFNIIHPFLMSPSYWSSLDTDTKTVSTHTDIILCLPLARGIARFGWAYVRSAIPVEIAEEPRGSNIKVRSCNVPFEKNFQMVSVVFTQVRRKTFVTTSLAWEVYHKKRFGSPSHVLENQRPRQNKEKLAHTDNLCTRTPTWVPWCSRDTNCSFWMLRRARILCFSFKY